ncbi:MAG TPA: transporter substrate-binding domain-containing protein [Spirochaetales bacterium]|nr:transporter substrate-binding domain-containing protein [Spirochaetales bacterium]HRY53292.1 transporter substrate-binding domain-containing protein [Spirochaetia bacterium]
MGKLIAALALAASLAPALAAQGREARLAVGEQPPLFSPSGGIVDLVVGRALASQGYSVELEWLPIGRMLALLQQDGLAAYISASNAPGQENPHVDFLQARGVFFYKRSRFPSLEPRRLEDLAGLRVATVLNSPNTPIFRKAGMIVDEGPYDTWFTKLDIGRVELLATADVGGLLAIKQLFPGRESEFGFTELSYSTISAGLYAKDDPALLEAARRGLRAIKADGSLEAMLKSFFGAEHWRRVRILE